MRKFLSAEAYDCTREGKSLCEFGLTEVGIPALIAAGSSLAAGAGTAVAGIGAGITAGGLTGGVAAGLGDLGLGSGLSAALAPVLTQAGIGAGLGALTGQPGTGAALGALSGGLGQIMGPSSGGALNATIPGTSMPGAFGQTITQPSTTITAPAIGGGALQPAAAAGNPLAQTAGKIAGSNSGLSGPLAILAALAQNANRPSTTAPAAMTMNSPLNPTGYLNRSMTNAAPTSGSYYTYGQSPEPQFYNGNQLQFAHGGALNRMIAMRKMAGGGADGNTFSTGGGDNYVQGDGGGQEDNVDAKLSPGEFVMDAGTVSRLGDGNSNEGAKRFQQIRQAIASDTKSDGVVQRKARSPLEYLQKAA